MAKVIERDDDKELNADVKASYDAVAAHGRSSVSGCFTLQRIAKAFLKWDNTAAKSERKDLERFASMSLTAENCSWQTELSFREAFRRAIISSAENGVNKKGETDPGDQRVRAVFMAAISLGASEDDIKRALRGADTLDQIEAEEQSKSRRFET